jgi:hypothetical protein
MAQASEHPGEWWLADRPERRVPGVLKIDEDGRSNLEVIGALRSEWEFAEAKVLPNGTVRQDMTVDAMERSSEFGRVLGEGVDGKAFTLDSCHLGSSQHPLMGGIGREEIRIGQMYRGVQLDPGEDAAFDDIRVEFQWLAQWLMESAIRETFTWRDDNGKRTDRKMEVGIQALASRRIRPWTGLTVSLDHIAGLSGDRFIGRSVVETFYFTAQTPGLTPVKDLLRVVSDLQSLVAFGVHRTAGIEKVTLRHPDIHHPNRPGRKYRREIDLIVPWTYRATEGRSTISDHDMAFTFPQIGRMEGVRKWLKVAAQHRDPLDRVAASMMTEGMLVSDALLHRAAALEAFDRERDPAHKKQTHFKERLLRSVAYAGDPFTPMVTNLQGWAKRITDERNDAAHTLSLGSDAEEQYYLSESLYWLFVQCMLRAAGMPAAPFSHMTTTRAFQHIARKMRSLGY